MWPEETLKILFQRSLSLWRDRVLRYKPSGFWFLVLLHHFSGSLYPKKERVNGSHLTVAVTEINSAGMVFQRVRLDWFEFPRPWGSFSFALLLNQCWRIHCLLGWDCGGRHPLYPLLSQTICSLEGDFYLVVSVTRKG